MKSVLFATLIAAALASTCFSVDSDTTVYEFSPNLKNAQLLQGHDSQGKPFYGHIVGGTYFFASSVDGIVFSVFAFSNVTDSQGKSKGVAYKIRAGNVEYIEKPKETIFTLTNCSLQQDPLDVSLPVDASAPFKPNDTYCFRFNGMGTPNIIMNLDFTVSDYIFYSKGFCYNLMYAENQVSHVLCIAEPDGYALAATFRLYPGVAQSYALRYFTNYKLNRQLEPEQKLIWNCNK